MPYTDKEKQKQYKKKWNAENYIKNKSSEKKRIRKRRKEITQWFYEYKAGLHCEKCGENTSICLDFHHRNPYEKEVSIANIKNWGWGKDRILKEMKKCVVLCSNCHRKLHAGLLKI